MNKRYDVVVAGGGLSGVAAAISAAREGVSVLLIEKNGCLGGALANNLVYPFMPYWLRGVEERTYLSAGIFREIVDRQKEYHPCDEKNVYHQFGTDMEFNSEYFKIVLDDMVSEAGVDVLFHAKIYDVKADNGKLQGIYAAVPSGTLFAEADFFVDATGDGEVFSLAGCDCLLGRESDNLCQPMTTCFRMSGVDIPAFREEKQRLQSLYKEKQAQGDITNPREDILVFYGVGEGILHFNTTRVVKLNPVDPIQKSRAEMEARRQVREMTAFFKENSKAFKNSTLVYVAAEIGIRESRKLKGKYILTGEDLKNCTVFPDSIARGNYDIDIHNPSGTGTSHYFFNDGKYYTIPYRSLLPVEYDNLLVAGRCISATHEAQASVRIMPTCCCLGQAAGTAAIALKTSKTAHTVDIKLVRETLKNNSAII